MADSFQAIVAPGVPSWSALKTALAPKDLPARSAARARWRAAGVRWVCGGSAGRKCSESARSSRPLSALACGTKGWAYDEERSRLAAK